MTHGKKRRVVILGSTGSIGLSTLKVAESLFEEIEIVGLAACSSVSKLAEQALETGVKHIGIYDETKESELRSLLPSDVKIHTGAKGLEDLSQLTEADIVLVA
ncbi:MAG: 1-deoxy-D-xylulose-5-phosphate reductoisomerase, partial [Planctomycetota bacterium]